MSDKQDRANRENARQSTGPRTDEGKGVSARNATRHGLLARETVLPDEDADAFEAFETSLRAHLAPVGELEALLADRVVSTAWRLRRVGRIEAGILTAHYFDALLARAQAVADRYVSASGPWTPEETAHLFGTSTVTDEGRHAAALEKLEAVRDARDAREDTALGRAFMRDHEADTVSKLSRYEAALERGLYRALHELQRLQAVRHGAVVPAPVAVDVTVDRPDC